MGEWLKPADCKSALFEYEGSNPSLSTKQFLNSTVGSCAALLMPMSVVRAHLEEPKNVPGVSGYCDPQDEKYSDMYGW